ncbi:MAG TPA: D-amino acid aminotransferase [Burkholderiaceae bacterium]|jgi:D-alanine transaminase|nr:D-amino acid aminotransferase [Burkholderiaceae bacterium]
MIPDVDNDSLVYLNGEYVRLADAKVSVLDRGFIFGDGVYDVVPAYGGKPFRMAEHLARLERSMAAIGIVCPLRRSDWEAIVQGLIARSGLGDCMVYLQVTRGVARRDHGFPAGIEPTLFGMVSPFKRPDATLREQGLSAIGIPDQRWLRCDIKSVSLLGNVLARQAAIEAGVDDVIQFRDGFLSEASAANIWVVRNGELLAPPRDHLILEGIRYGLLEQLAREVGVPFSARPISEEEVATADELLLTSATKEVLPITRYNGQPVGQGKAGPVYARLRAAYDAVIEAS